MNSWLAQEGTLSKRQFEEGRMYLSVSCSANTFRLVWSRMVLILMKHPKSSFLARNIDILRIVAIELEIILGVLMLKHIMDELGPRASDVEKVIVAL